MSSNKHITNDQRNEISLLLREGYKKSEIAKILNKHRSSISREIERNSEKNRHYHARIAKEKSNERRFNANQRNKIKSNYWLCSFVKKNIKKTWSPEQISGRLFEFYDISISTDCIYKYIYEDQSKLIKKLRHASKGKYRRKRGTCIRKKRREVNKKTFIDKRPDIINSRKRIGDFEGDLMIGTDKKSALVTYTERKSLFEIIFKMDIRSADNVNKLTIEGFNKLPENKRCSITYDNGKEFDKFTYIEKKTGMEIYFAHKYSSWERGTNENANGLIRQFIPKKISLKDIDQKQLNKIAYLLNSRPRKKLNYATPTEIFNEVVAF